MEECPLCGKWLKFNIKYFCGYPYIFYNCDCGYDERNYQSFASTNFEVTGNPNILLQNRVFYN